MTGIMDKWKNQGKGVKIGSIIGVCCLGLLIIGLILGMGSPDQTTAIDNATTSTTSSDSSTTSSTTNTPKVVTINQLYGSSIAEGTYVKVTGTVLESDGYNLRIENSDGKDILIEGTDLSAYEDKSITVVGTYDGPSTYTTVMGGSRTVPTLTDGEIVK